MRAVSLADAYLLPMLWGRGVHRGDRRLTVVLDAWWPWGLVAVNLGAKLILVPPCCPVAALGWVLVTAGVGGFVVLAIVATATAVGLRATPRRRRSAWRAWSFLVLAVRVAERGLSCGRHRAPRRSAGIRLSGRRRRAS